MSRYRAFLFLAILAGISFLPNVASAQGFFGPIVPSECAACEFGAGWGCVLETVKNLINLGLTIAISFAVLLIAYAGFLWVTNPANPENLSKGKSVLKNAVIGLVIALGAWIIVNTILLALTGTGVAGTTAVLGDTQKCLPGPATPSGSGGAGGLGTTSPSTGGGGSGTAAGLSGTQQWRDEIASACARSGTGLTDCARVTEAIMAVECNSGNPSCISPAGAIGLMQMIPSTACATGGSSIPGCSGSRVTDSAAVRSYLQNPSNSISLGVQHLIYLQDHTNSFDDMVAAYNGGLGSTRPSRTCQGTTVWACEQNGGYLETRKYVPKVKATYNALQ